MPPAAEVLSNPNCLICYGRCGISTRNTVNIFEQRTFSQRNFPAFISQVIEVEVKDGEVSSVLMCKKCFKLFDELDELEQRAADIKELILSTFEGALKRKDEQDVQDDLNSVETLQIQGVETEEHELEEPEISTVEEIGEVEDLNKDDVVISVQDVNGLETETGQIYSFSAESSERGSIEQDDIAEDVMNAVDDSYVMVKQEAEDVKPNLIKRKAILQQKKTTPKKVKIEVLPKIISRDGDVYICLLCPPSSHLSPSSSPPTTTSMPFRTTDGKLITAHVRAMHDARTYICDVCGDDFRKRTDLSAHLDEHVASEEGDFQCETCNRIFSNLRLFRIHRRMHLPQQKAWTCDRCGKKYSSKNLLDEHMNMHTGQRPYTCATCGKDFASKYTFKSHEKTHAVRPRPFRCSHCNKAFLSQQNLMQHERTHTGVKEYQCHLCEKQFHSAHNLEVHSIVHTGYKPFRCRTCNKSFARKAEIRDHERIHTGERPYQCEMCGATFSQRSNLQSHKRATHFDDKRYKCDACGKAFKRRRLLDYHVKAIHTGERPFKCGECKATFVYPEHYKKHRRIHTGEKPFHCEVCNKAFSSRDNRNAHRYIHSDKKPYECLLCGAGFMRKPLLYQHMQNQGHMNDTIVVNQPRLTTRDRQIITVNADGELELVEDPNEDVEFIGEQPHLMMLGDDDELEYEEMEDLEDDEDEDSKLYITEQLLVHAAAASTTAEDESGATLAEEDSECSIVKTSDLDESGGTLIFNEVMEDDDDDEHIIIDSSQLQLAEVDENIHYEELEGDSMILGGDKIISASETSIINTKNGPIQVVQVRIPNDKGEEEDAWIKIVDG